MRKHRLLPRERSPRKRAEKIAVAVGGGPATWSGREDERGATWEVEVTRPDGSEADVHIAEDGRTVALIPKLGAADAKEGAGDGADGGDGDIVSQDEAERGALAAVGEGHVSWSGPEDDRGAAWEIEVTRPDGSEVDVLIAADGSVVDSRATGLPRYCVSSDGLTATDRRAAVVGGWW